MLEIMMSMMNATNDDKVSIYITTIHLKSLARRSYLSRFEYAEISSKILSPNRGIVPNKNVA